MTSSPIHSRGTVTREAVRQIILDFMDGRPQDLRDHWLVGVDQSADAVLALFPVEAGDVGWRPIETHDGSSDPVLLIGLYRDGKTWSDVYHAWRQPPFIGVEGDQCEGRWARWPHPFPPTHFQPITVPAASPPLAEGQGHE